jgi:hypothetical protein
VQPLAAVTGRRPFLCRVLVRKPSTCIRFCHGCLFCLCKTIIARIGSGQTEATANGNETVFFAALSAVAPSATTAASAAAGGGVSGPGADLTQGDHSTTIASDSERRDRGTAAAAAGGSSQRSPSGQGTRYREFALVSDVLSLTAGVSHCSYC